MDRDAKFTVNYQQTKSNEKKERDTCRLIFMNRKKNNFKEVGKKKLNLIGTVKQK